MKNLTNALILSFAKLCLKLIQRSLNFIHDKSVRLLTESERKLQQVKFGDEKIFQTEKEVEAVEEVIDALFELGTKMESLNYDLKNDPKFNKVYPQIKNSFENILTNIRYTLHNFENFRDVTMVHDILAEKVDLNQDGYELCILTSEDSEKLV